MAVIAAPAAAQVGARDSANRIKPNRSPEGPADPVARLQAQLEIGKNKLKFEPKRGYLSSLLEKLNIPVSSQTLVFSKTSSQREQVSPKTPRAIYFSTDVYVGWAPECPVIDIAAMDPERGANFYTLDQRESATARITQRFDCAECHESAKTLHVPGVFVRSAYTAGDGTPLATVQDFVSGHTSSLEKRWAGWYVTGTHVSARALLNGGVSLKAGDGELHLGNLISYNVNEPEQVDVIAGANLTDLRTRFDASRYLSPHSDIVALLVLEHQVCMHNLITKAGYETRFALAELEASPKSPADLAAISLDSPWPQQRIARAGELLLEYMLFQNEAPLKGPVGGTSPFASEFQRGGPRASGGRSLRQFDLKSRLFRYPCSFLIYSPGFDALPPQMKNYLWRRLEQILNGWDDSPVYAKMLPADRKAVLEILRQTKPEFAAKVFKVPMR